MKLDPDCIRECMLYIEKNLDYTTPLEVTTLEFKSFRNIEVIYTFKKLEEAGYIIATIAENDFQNIIKLVIFDITWAGHEFINTIRDTKVWSETKSIISKFSSVPTDIIIQVASNVITNIIFSSVKR